MRKGIVAALTLAALAGVAGTSHAQAPRKDYVWARTTAGPLTLDGLLNEALFRRPLAHFPRDLPRS